MIYSAYKLHKGEWKRYTQLNARFQRIVRRDKKALFSEQCRKIEENNRMVKIGEDWITHKWHYFFKREINKKGPGEASAECLWIIFYGYGQTSRGYWKAKKKKKKVNCWEPKLSDFHLVSLCKALVVFQLFILLKSLCPRVLWIFSGNTRSHLKTLFEMDYS